jgi:ABC-2 type transport system permease protein
VVAHLVRLKLALLRGGLRSSVWKVVGLVLGAVYAVLLVVLAVAGLVVLGVQEDRELPRTVLTLAGTALVAGWWLLPLVAFGVDSTLDPARFRLFPVPRRQLLTGLAVAGLVGLPGVATVLVAVATPLAWWREAAAVPAALVGGLLGTAICVVGSRAVTTVLAPLVTGRRFREVAAVLAVVPLVLAGPIVLGVGAGLAAVADALPRIAVVVGWTPFGAPWALAADVAEGSWLAAVAKLAVAVVTLVVLAVVWDRALAAALVRPEGGGRVARSTGLGFFGRLPATPTGAVAARSLTYWLRDSRYAASVAVVPVMVLLLWFLGRGGGSLLGAGVLVAFIMGWVSSADVSSDGTAFWLHVAAPLTGRADRTGRALAGLVVGGAVVLVVNLVVLAVGRRADHLARRVRGLLRARRLPGPQTGREPVRHPAGHLVRRDGVADGRSAGAPRPVPADDRPRCRGDLDRARGAHRARRGRRPGAGRGGPGRGHPDRCAGLRLPRPGAAAGAPVVRLSRDRDSRYVTHMSPRQHRHGRRGTPGGAAL